tara:strand:+ start:1188 stop:1823 length:636 start_codon:yes stop_codon:yes gene_type:complete
MAHQFVWYFTDLPEKVVGIIEDDLKDKFDTEMKDSLLYRSSINKDKRNSQNTWVPTTHWVAGFIWHYVERANRENFLYDLTHIDGENMQYTRYGEGQYYGWHNDSSLPSHYKPSTIINGENSIDNQDLHKQFLNKSCEHVRKLSFTLQLSHPDEYEGGNIEFKGLDGDKYIAPRKRGSIILFDSRINHRVCEIIKGERKSIVGWVLGPRWK